VELRHARASEWFKFTTTEAVVVPDMRVSRVGQVEAV
jgi:hypothetical protein